MHALEQAIADDLLRRLAEQLLGGGEANTRALFVVACDHVGRVLGEQPVALLAGAHRSLRAVVHELDHTAKAAA